MSEQFLLNRWHTAVAMCVLLMGGGGAAVAADPANCKLTRITTVELVVKDYFAYVPVVLNGHAGLMSLQIDLPDTYIFQGAIDASGVKTRSTTTTLKSRDAIENRVALYDSLEIGSARFGTGKMIVMPESPMPMEIDGVPVFGSLGAGLIQTQDFELDLARKKMALYRQDHCKGKVVYWANEWAAAPLKKTSLGVPYMVVELENRRLKAAFAPGDPTTTLTTDVTQQLFGFDASSPGVITERVNANSIYHYRAMSLTAPDMQVRNTRIRLLELKNALPLCKLDVSERTGTGYTSRCGNIFPMRLGRNLLQSLHLYFATKEKVVYFTLAEPTQSSAPVQQ